MTNNGNNETTDADTLASKSEVNLTDNTNDTNKILSNGEHVQKYKKWVEIGTLVLGVGTILLTGYNVHLTHHVSEEQNKISKEQNKITKQQNNFTQKMILSVQSEKDNLEKIKDTVSQTQSISKKIILTEKYQQTNKAELESLSDKVTTIQDSYFANLNQKNSYAGQLDKALTTKLEDTRGRIEYILHTEGGLELAKTGGVDPQLDKIFSNYQTEEQKLINESVK